MFRRPDTGDSPMRLIAIGFALLATIASSYAANKVTTPANNNAAIFFPLGFEEQQSERQLVDYFSEQLKLESYKITEYFDESGPEDDDPHQATATNFLQLGRYGIVIVDTHGEKDDLMVEVYKTEKARDKAWKDTYGFPNHPKDPWQKGDLFQCEGDSTTHGADLVRYYAICITAEAIKTHITKGPTILAVAACLAFGLRDDFTAVREYFGYDQEQCASRMKEDSELLWGRMSGVKDDGTHRQAGEAYGAGSFNPGFKYQHKAGEPETVLAPGVIKTEPTMEQNVKVGSTLNSLVTFDALMDTGKDASTVITISGLVKTEKACGSITNTRWKSGNELSFTFQANAIGNAGLEVVALQALADPKYGYANKLDGNQDPPRKLNRVAPNGDNYRWLVSCVGGE
jgi:hypothetical protein